MSDQHHAGVMGCAGDTIVQTPNLDRLAQSGVRFSNAYCPYPLCVPSRMSSMTGRHPHELDQWDNECQLKSDIPTFAHAFLSAGYDTVLSGRMHFVGLDQKHGFAEIIRDNGPLKATLTAFDLMTTLRRKLGKLWDTPFMSLSSIVKSGPGRSVYLATDEAVTERTVAWLQQRSKNHNKPLLLTVGFITPHCPFVALPGDFALYKDQITVADLPQWHEILHPRNVALRKNWGIDPAAPIDAQWRTRVAYYGLTTFMDRQAGSVLSAWEQAGLADNSIIVYCSDHGEALGEHGMWWKSTFYDGSSRVPLIVSWPGHFKPGESRTENVSLMDIGTSLIDLVGVDPLPGASGKSFQHLLTGEKGRWDDTVFAEYEVDAVCRMVRSGPWKYNYYHGMEPELFNVQEDSGEMINLAGQAEYHDIVQRLHDLALQNWDPDKIQVRKDRWRQQELRLIADYERITNPLGPDSLSYSAGPENWVDNTIKPNS